MAASPTRPPQPAGVSSSKQTLFYPSKLPLHSNLILFAGPKTSSKISSQAYLTKSPKSVTNTTRRSARARYGSSRILWKRECLTFWRRLSSHGIQRTQELTKAGVIAKEQERRGCNSWRWNWIRSWHSRGTTGICFWKCLITRRRARRSTSKRCFLCKRNMKRRLSRLK